MELSNKGEQSNWYFIYFGFLSSSIICNIIQMVFNFMKQNCKKKKTNKIVIHCICPL